MEAKLTLRLDDVLIGRAKRYAAARETSVSQLVAGYFDLLTAPQCEVGEGSSGPIVRQLHGLLAGSGLDEADYRRHLEDKHWLQDSTGSKTGAG
jgi:hypothetical protein